MTAQPVTLEGLRKTYRRRGLGPLEAVWDLDLKVGPGELVALLGPSGCGETTVLRMIAGLEAVTAGTIRIGDREVQDLAPGKRGVGLASHALYPPLTVRENLAYGLRARGVHGAAQQVTDLAHRLGLTDLLGLRPAGLSSGQKQRVALARALIGDPKVLLVDEAPSHLDEAQRRQARRELKALHREFGCTTIVATHDQAEALSLADRIAVMNLGRIEQLGTPGEIYDDPANSFVAGLVGETTMNFIEGTVTHGPRGDVAVRIGAHGLLLTDVRGADVGQPVTVGLRPQDTRPATPDEPAVTGTVTGYADLMEFGQATLALPGVDGRILAQTPPGLGWRRCETRRITARPDRVYLFHHDTTVRIR